MPAIPKGPDTEVRVQRSTYRGRERVDIREFWQPADAEQHVATRKGVNLPLEDLPQLLAALRAIEADAIRSGGLLVEDYQNAGLEPPAELTEAA